MVVFFTQLYCHTRLASQAYVEMPFSESGCVVAGDYLLIECVGIAAVQLRSVQSNSIYWTWLVVIGWAACVAPAQVGGQASMQ